MNSYAVRRSRIATSARLACLIHAANVHSEPGSNPSKICIPKVSPRLIAKGLKLFAVPVQDGENKQFVSQNSKAHKLNHVVKEHCRTQKFDASDCQVFSFESAGCVRRRGKYIETKRTVNPTLSIFF